MNLVKKLAIDVSALIGITRASGVALAEAEAPREQIAPRTAAEPMDLHPRAVLWAGVGTLLGLWAIVLTIYPLFTYFKYERTGGKDPAKVLMHTPPLPPTPRNEAYPVPELNQFLAREDYMLSHYQWVDRSHGVVRIPIEAAIHILARRGVPPSKPGGTEYYAPRAGSMGTGFEGKVEPVAR